jgi:dethiobiotin synthetase
MAILFITGIDTGIGKTVACGLLARFLLRRGESAITQKLVQTGGRGISADIRTHRRLMGVALTSEDRTGLTCPYVFRLPSSPHLAAAREGVRIDPKRLATATRRLAALYDYVLVEGAGGIEVPLQDDFTTLDYIADRGCDVIVVSSSRLGSINHTLLTLRALRSRAVHVRGIVYNCQARENRIVAEDTKLVLLRALRRCDYPAVVVDLPRFRRVDKPPELDFSPLLGMGKT